MSTQTTITITISWSDNPSQSLVAEVAEMLCSEVLAAYGAEPSGDRSDGWPGPFANDVHQSVARMAKR